MTSLAAAGDNALIRVARQGDGHRRYWLDLRGVEYLQIEGGLSASKTAKRRA